MADLKASIRITLIDEANRAAARVNASFAKLGQTTEGLSATSNRASSAAAQLAQSQAAAQAEAAQLRARLQGLQASGEGSQAEIAQLSGRIAQLTTIEAQAGAKLAAFENRIEKLAGSSNLSAMEVRQLDAQVLKLSATASSASARLERMAKSTGKVAPGLKGVAKGTTAVQKGSRRLSKEQRAANLAFAEGINLTTELAFSSLSLSKATMPLGIALAGAGNNAYSFARFLGPLGIGIATLATAIPGVIGLVSNLGDETGDAANANERLTNSGKFVNRFFEGVKGKIRSANEETRDYLSLIDGFIRANEEADRASRIRKGQGSVAETEAAIRAARVRREGIDAGGAVTAEQQKASVAGQVAQANEVLFKRLKDRSFFTAGEVTNYVSRKDLEESLKELQAAAVSGKAADIDAGQFLISRVARRASARGEDPNAAANAIVELAADSAKFRKALADIEREAKRAAALLKEEDYTRGISLPIAEQKAQVKTVEDSVDPLIETAVAGLPRRRRKRAQRAIDLAREEGDFSRLQKIGLDDATLNRLVALIRAEDAAKRSEERTRHNEVVTALRSLGGGFFSSDPLGKARSGGL